MKTFQIARAVARTKNSINKKHPKRAPISDEVRKVNREERFVKVLFRKLSKGVRRIVYDAFEKLRWLPGNFWF